MIMGWSGAATCAQIAAIWGKLFRTSDPAMWRKHLWKAMTKWADNHKVEIDHSVFLEQWWLEDMLDVKPNPGGPVAIYAQAEKGVSPLAFMPKSPDRITELQRRETAAKESRNNWGFGDAMKWGKTDPSDPPLSYAEWKANKTTFAAFLAVAFTESCPLFQDVWGVRRIMVNLERLQHHKKVTASLCTQDTWACIAASRDFFDPARALTAEDVEPSMVQFAEYPQSDYLVVGDQIKHVQPIIRVDFPEKWRAIAQAEDMKRERRDMAGGPPPHGQQQQLRHQQSLQRGGMGGFVPVQQQQQWRGGGVSIGGGEFSQWNAGSAGQGRGRGTPRGAAFGGPNFPGGPHPQGQSRFGGPRPDGPPSSGFGGGGAGGGGRPVTPDHRHPHFRTWMAAYLQKFNGVLHMKEALQAMGKTEADIPVLGNFVDQAGNNCLCMQHLLSTCRFGNRCNYTHIQGAEVPDNYASTLTAFLDQGLGYLFANKNAPGPPSPGGGRGRKRGRPGGGGGGGGGAGRM